MKQIILLFVLLFSFESQAQSTAVDSTIRQSIDDFFVALNSGDSTLMRSCLHPTLVLRTCHIDKNNQTVLSEENLIDLLEAVKAPRDLSWEERIYNVEIKSDDRLSVVWAPYTFYLGKQYSHEGVNVFELVQENGKWLIISITDTRRKISHD